MRLFGSDSSKLCESFLATRDGPAALAFSQGGAMLACSTHYDNEIELLEVATGKLKNYLLGHQAPVDSLAISTDNRLLASGGRDGTIKFWDFESGRLLASIMSGPK